MALKPDFSAAKLACLQEATNRLQLPGCTCHLQRELAQALAGLTPRDRDVALSRFRDDQTLQEIGDRLGVTRERVRQLEVKVRAKLRAALDGDARVAEVLAVGIDFSRNRRA